MHARGQDLAGEQACQIGAAVATVALAEATRGVFAAAAAAGQPSPAPACGVGAGAVGAAIGKFRAESGATTRAVAPVPGGAGGDTRAANLRSA